LICHNAIIDLRFRFSAYVSQEVIIPVEEAGASNRPCIDSIIQTSRRKFALARGTNGKAPLPGHIFYEPVITATNPYDVPRFFL
jgi:hypothetical protein